MKVNAIKCDCVGCNNVSDIMNVVTINGKTYDICVEHSKVLNDMFNLGMRTEQKTEQTETEVNVTDKKEKQTAKAVEKTDKKVEKTDKKVEKTDKKVEKTDKKVEKTESTEHKAIKKGDYTTLIEQYGVDKLRTEYVDNNKSASKIAKSIGIPKTALCAYLFKNNISKRTKKHDDDTKSDKEGV